jgi:hypothetical protein
MFLGECPPPSSGQNVSFLILYPENGEACSSKMSTEKVAVCILETTDRTQYGIHEFRRQICIQTRVLIKRLLVKWSMISSQVNNKENNNNNNQSME